jgi:hypothetical protein
MSFQMRAACRKCGHGYGSIETRNGQDCVWCGNCGAFQYNAPKTETGRAPRTVTTIHNGIKAGQRARILLRASGSCELCHAANKPLHAGHLLSVNEGMKLGLTEAEINSDENLAAMCDECNLGLSDQPIPLRLLVAILKARIKNHVSN